MDNLMSFFIFAFIAIFVIVNPLSGLFTFMSMTSGYSKKSKNAYAKKSIFLAACLSIFFAVAGSFILQLFNISIDALRIAGGLILISVGFNMMTAKVNPVVSQTEIVESTDKDFWIFPIAIPLLCGPGTISTVTVLSGTATAVADIAVILVAIASVYIISYIMFRSSEIISRYISYTGMLVITRLLGLLLTAIAVGMVMAGLHNYLLELLQAFFTPIINTAV
ncbi:MAG: MarC family protein [Methanimicrococcus sp.]|nr:MarC family protein [Methanimicrococcus sp.]